MPEKLRHATIVFNGTGSVFNIMNATQCLQCCKFAVFHNALLGRITRLRFCFCNIVIGNVLN